SHVGLFSFQPRRLWRLICVGTALYNYCDVFTKLSLDMAQSVRAATILHGIMQQRGDRFLFVRTIFHCDRSDTKDMRNVRNSRLLPELSAMDPRGVSQCLFKLTRQLHSCVSRQRPVATVSVVRTRRTSPCQAAILQKQFAAIPVNSPKHLWLSILPELILTLQQQHSLPNVRLMTCRELAASRGI